MRRTGLVVAGLVAVLVVAGAVVSSTDDGGERAVVESDVATSAAAEPATGGRALAGDSGVGSAPAPGLPQTVAPTGPRVVRTADLAVEVEEGRFGAAFDRAAAVAASHGGYVTSSSTGGAGLRAERDGPRPRSGQLTLRVPADRFDDARRALGQLGEVEQEGIRGEDVSGQLVDYEARLRSLRAQEESLQALLGKAANVGEVLQVQTALFNVRQQIEQLDGQRAQLEQAAALATISVSLYEPGAALPFDPEPEPASSLARSFERAVEGALAVVGGMIVVLGWVTPLAVLGLLGWGAARLRRRPAAPASVPPAPVAS
ncbi:MAG: DUF4349 domain-containing protein [Acidimicrobiia bacterium]